MTMTTKGILAELEKLHNQLKGLSAGTDNAIEVIRLRLARWKERAVVFLRENVSEGEGERLRETQGVHNLDDPGLTVMNDWRAYSAYVTSLILDLNEGHELHGDPTPAEMRRALSSLQLHPNVIEVAGKLFRDGHYRQAILDTYIALVDAVKAKSGMKDRDGVPLMEAAFSPQKPKLRASTDKDEQLGFMWLFSGAVMAIRNPNAHRLMAHEDVDRALELLCLASSLFRILDEAQVGP